MHPKRRHLFEQILTISNVKWPWANLLFLIMVVVFSALIAGSTSPSNAASGPSKISRLCIDAAHMVSRESGVPVSVLLAITLTETGRSPSGTLEPWPWTVNMEGKGVWFTDRARAQAYIDGHFKRGARSFDVGCFQINYRWHGDAFSSLEEMFDPFANARYAARFLKELHLEFGSWSKAAGAYHSRTPEFANRYRARFDEFRANLDDPTSPLIKLAATDLNSHSKRPRPSDNSVRPNLFPLLRSGSGRQGFGSLVPLYENPASGHRMIGGSSRG